MDQDGYLDEAARSMIAAAARSQSALKVLHRQCPSIYHQIRRLRACRAPLALWGRSLNVDEIARELIVHPAILQAIGQLSQVPIRGRIVHAGLEHTYGYLFSLIETPFGHKRERWTQAAIEDGFGIQVPTLRPQPAEGTLLTNLTWFAGQIAFRDRPRELGLLQRLSGDVSPVVQHYAYSRLEIGRVIEEVTLATAAGTSRAIRLQTILVPFPCPPDESKADNHLLVYSIINGRAAPARLITAFAVNQDMANHLTAQENQGDVVLESLPYNAYVRGLSGRPFQARRHVEWPARGH